MAAIVETRQISCDTLFPMPQNERSENIKNVLKQFFTFFSIWYFDKLSGFVRPRQYGVQHTVKLGNNK